MGSVVQWSLLLLVGSEEQHIGSVVVMGLKMNIGSHLQLCPKLCFEGVCVDFLSENRAVPFVLA